MLNYLNDFESKPTGKFCFSKVTRCAVVFYQGISINDNTNLNRGFPIKQLECIFKQGGKHSPIT